MVGSRTVENFVFVVIDALRADLVGVYGYRSIKANIDRLANEGSIFQNAFTTTNATDPAITSLLTGKYPILWGLNHGNRVSDEEKRCVENVMQLQEILSKDEYETYKDGRVLSGVRVTASMSHHH